MKEKIKKILGITIILMCAVLFMGIVTSPVRAVILICGPTESAGSAKACQANLEKLRGQQQSQAKATTTPVTQLPNQTPTLMPTPSPSSYLSPSPSRTPFLIVAPAGNSTSTPSQTPTTPPTSQLTNTISSLQQQILVLQQQISILRQRIFLLYPKSQ